MIVRIHNGGRPVQDGSAGRADGTFVPMDAALTRVDWRGGRIRDVLGPPG
jgi:hypothetical protein